MSTVLVAVVIAGIVLGLYGFGALHRPTMAVGLALSMGGIVALSRIKPRLNPKKRKVAKKR